MGLDARLAGPWTPAELGVHPVAGGGPLPAYVGRPLDERLRVMPASPVAGGRLVVVRGKPRPGTSRAAREAVAGVLARWPLEDPRTAAVLATADCIKAARYRLCLVERRRCPCCSPRCCRCTVGPSRGGTGTAGGPVAAWCSGGQRRLTDA